MSVNIFSPLKSTTVVAVRKDGIVVLGADGQATLGETVMKGSVNKLRKLSGGKILAGFAGATAHAFILLEKLEEKLHARGSNLYYAVLNLAKEWRTSRSLRVLEAVMIVADQEQTLMVSGSGDVMRPDDDIVAIGSGGSYAHAAAIALKKHASHLSAEEIVRESLKIAGDICIYTNHNFVIEKLVSTKK